MRPSNPKNTHRPAGQVLIGSPFLSGPYGYPYGYPSALTGQNINAADFLASMNISCEAWTSAPNKVDLASRYLGKPSSDPAVQQLVNATASFCASYFIPGAYSMWPFIVRPFATYGWPFLTNGFPSFRFGRGGGGKRK